MDDQNIKEYKMDNDIEKALDYAEKLQKETEELETTNFTKLYFFVIVLLLVNLYNFSISLTITQQAILYGFGTLLLVLISISIIKQYTKAERNYKQIKKIIDCIHRYESPASSDVEWLLNITRLSRFKF